MREYLISVVVCAFFMGVLKMITPQGAMKKQAESVIALMVIVVLISPIINMSESFDEFGSVPDFGGGYIYDTTLDNYAEKEQTERFEKAMSDYINETIYNEFQVYINADVKAKTDSGTIMGVKRVYIYIDTETINKVEAICKRICSELGIEREQIEVM